MQLYHDILYGFTESNMNDEMSDILTLLSSSLGTNMFEQRVWRLPITSWRHCSMQNNGSIENREQNLS